MIFRQTDERPYLKATKIIAYIHQKSTENQSESVMTLAELEAGKQLGKIRSKRPDLKGGAYADPE
ncbi:MAG: hypothetical protein ACLSA6_04215 [Holdemania massiliensis]